MSDHQVQTAPVLPAEEMLRELRLIKRLWPKVSENVGLGDGAEEVAALEQAIKVLEALSSPGFHRLERARVLNQADGILPPIPPERACGVAATKPGERLASTFYAPTMFAALLKAYESLYPSTQPAAAPSGPDKEENTSE